MRAVMWMVVVVVVMVAGCSSDDGGGSDTGDVMGSSTLDGGGDGVDGGDGADGGDVCLSDADCRQGGSCVGGVCVPCDEDGDCPFGEVCELQAGGNAECVRIECASLEGCGLGLNSAPRACEEGVCKAAECTSDAECTTSGEACIERLCRPFTCVSDADCGEGEICNPVTGACVEGNTVDPGEQGWPCSGDADCNDNLACGDGGECIAVYVETDLEESTIYLDGPGDLVVTLTNRGEIAAHITEVSFNLARPEEAWSLAGDEPRTLAPGSSTELIITYSGQDPVGDAASVSVAFERGRRITIDLFIAM